jgi:hypothetical protein
VNVNANIVIGAGQIVSFFFLLALGLVFIFLQLNKIEKLLKRRGSNPAVRMVLALPIITNKLTGEVMADLVVLNDTIESVPIQYEDQGQQVVPGPPGDVLTATCSNPASLGVAIGGTATAPLLVLTPLVQVSPGLTVTVTDSSNLPALARVVDIVADTKPTNIVLNDAGATTVPQAVPPNPGP